MAVKRTKKKKRLKGLVQVYTGDGKGKTTAAIGLCVRAAGHGLKSCIIQFMKGVDYGELKFCRNTDSIKILQYGTKKFVNSKPTNADVMRANTALQEAERIIKNMEFDIVVLDEINIAVAWKLVELSRVLKLIENKPDCVELILTGRYAHTKIIKSADLVTEMKEIKHPYRSGLKARMGIEY